MIFFAALFGVFRPYKFIPTSRRWHYGLAAFASLILVSAFAPKPGGDAETTAKLSAADSRTNGAEPSRMTGKQGAVDAPAKPKSKWHYDESKDEMRNSSRKFAELESENSIGLAFPYGDQKGYLTVRSDPQYGLDVMFSVRSGQILCHGFGDSYLNVKFDDGPIRRFNCSDASDGSSEVAFIRDASTFLAALKKADRTVVEAEFYQNGRVQYIFESQNLEWN
ncbi:MAG: hypothetical protein WC692_07730 [Erythrobacter sp.]